MLFNSSQLNTIAMNIIIVSKSVVQALNVQMVKKMMELQKATELFSTPYQAEVKAWNKP